jgi:phosphatidylglycerol:prolipoprotein diacylglycerol transferase
MICYIIPISIIGARIYYCLFNLDYYLNYPIDIIKIWEGGLAIHGGIIASLIFVYIYCKHKKINIFLITDIFVPALILGQAIGRWGNFFNSEAYGSPTNYLTLKSYHIPEFIIKGMHIGNTYYHPTFFYESIGCFIGFVIIMLLRKCKHVRIGQITSAYLIIYGILRFLIESMRQDSLMLGTLKIAQIVSIVMLISGIILFIFSKNHKKYNRSETDGKND